MHNDSLTGESNTPFHPYTNHYEGRLEGRRFMY
jgi:hypothetical protein